MKQLFAYMMLAVVISGCGYKGNLTLPQETQDRLDKENKNTNRPPVADSDYPYRRLSGKRLEQ